MQLYILVQKVWKTEEIDRRIHPDERHSLQISNNPIVLDWVIRSLHAVYYSFSFA